MKIKKKYWLLFLSFVLSSCSPESIYEQGESEGYKFYVGEHTMLSDGTNKKNIIDNLSYNLITYKSIFIVDSFYIKDYAYLLMFAAENEYLNLQSIYENNKNDINKYENFLIKYNLINDVIEKTYNINYEYIFDEIYLISSDNIYVNNIESQLCFKYMEEIGSFELIDKNLINDNSIEMPLIDEYENDNYKFYNEIYTSPWGVNEYFYLRYNKKTKVTEKMQSRSINEGKYAFNYIKEK